ncbi:hypothetical protein [Pseudomonas brassicacearum]|uniref:hypothetical protein n=1 Tax=Pseudomonas brassicacearum TaxID=930166 RepID=UPI00386214A1
MGVFAGGKLLFQGQAFVLLGLLLHRCRLAYLTQRRGLGLGQLRQLLAITPILESPRQHRRTTRQHCQ